MEQDLVIDNFLLAYNRVAATHYSVTARPDKDNRDSKDIDAIAETVGCPRLAIEHTRLETLALQNRDSAWFMEAFGPLEQELKDAFPYTLKLVFPYQNVTRGQKWPEMRAAVRQWLLTEADHLPIGPSDHQISGVPFTLTIWRHPHRLSQSLFLRRWESVTDLHDGLKAQMKRQLDHKYDRLGQYQATGAITVLLLESEDIALVNWGALYKAFLAETAANPRPYLNQVWVACTFKNDYEVCCFSGPDDLMDQANPPNYMFGRRYHAYWSAE